jgi:hypothetical protein
MTPASPVLGRLNRDEAEIGRIMRRSDRIFCCFICACILAVALILLALCIK